MTSIEVESTSDTFMLKIFEEGEDVMKIQIKIIKTVAIRAYFSLILLFVGNVVLAQDGHFSVESDDGAIVLSDVYAEVNINGPFAETTLELGFENTSSSLLQGTFKINLPSGVIINDLSLKINGQWEGGELIEKHSARKQYEAVVRRKVDPAVLSWINGSIYQVRIYPFPANDKRWIKIKYWQDLSNNSSNWQYLLPLTKDQKLDKLNMRLTVDAPSLKSVALSENYQQLAYFKAIANNNHRFESLVQENDFTVPGNFTLDISHSDDRHNAWVAKHTADGEHPYFAVHWLEDLEPVKRQPSGKLMIYIDTSLSMIDTSVDNLNSFIGDLIDKSKEDTHVIIKHFNYKVHDIASAKVKDLSGHQIMPVFDGASNYQAVLEDIANNKGSDVVIITDAQTSMQTEQTLKRFENLGVNLFFLPANNEFSQHWSSALALSNNGKILPILGTDFATIWGEFSNLSWQILSYEFDQGNGIDVFPRTGAKMNNKGVKVAFRSINSTPKSVRLKLKSGSHVKVLSANLDAAKISHSAEKLWAYRKLFELVGGSSDLSKEILLHAKRYQIVSPQTSYIVMEPGVPLITSNQNNGGTDEVHRIDDFVPPNLTNGGTSTSATLDLMERNLESESLLMIHALNDEVHRIADFVPPNDEGTGFIDSNLTYDNNRHNSKSNEACLNKTHIGQNMQYSRLDMVFDDHSSTPPKYFTKKLWSVADLAKEYHNNRSCHLNEAWFFIEYAQRFFEYNQKDRALSVLSNLFEIQQEDGNSLRALGLSSSLFAQHEWGEIAFGLLIQLRPEEVQNYRDLAWLYVEQGKYQIALDVLNNLGNIEWDRRFPALKFLVSKEARLIQTLMSEHNHQEELLYSYITWNTDNTDIDLWIDEGHPQHYLNYQRSYRSVGSLSNDFTSGYGPEVYFTTNPKNKPLGFYVNYFGVDNTVQNKSVVGKFGSIVLNQGKPVITTTIFPLFNSGATVRVQ